MITGHYSWRATDDLELMEIAAALQREGCSDLGSRLSDVMVEAVSWTGVDSVPNPISDPQSTVIVKGEQLVGRVVVRRSTARSTGGLLTVAIVAASESVADDFLGTLDAAAGVEREEGDTGLPDPSADLQARLATESPNGKVLSDPDIRLMIDLLYDRSRRDSMKTFADTYSTDAVTLDQLKKTLSGRTSRAVRDDRAQEVSQLVDDRHLFSSGWGIACKNCGWVSMRFQDKQAGVAAYQSGEISACPSCERREMGLLEIRHMDQRVLRAIQQNVWLEDLVASTLRSEATLCLTGRVTEDNSELDVVAVVSGRVVVVECKDGTFGGNDLAALLDKGRELDADYVGIVTTSRLHVNVLNRIESRRRDDLQTFFVHDTEDPDAIRTELQLRIEGIQQQVVADSVAAILEGPYGAPFRRYPGRLRVD